MDFPPWPIPEWSWIIPTQSSEGLFCSPGPTLYWCNARRLCFSDECAREGPRQEEGGCCPALVEWQGERKPVSSDACCRRNWQLTLSIGKFTLSLLLFNPHDCPQTPPPKPLQDHPSLRAHHSSPESSAFLKLVPAATPPFLCSIKWWDPSLRVPVGSIHPRFLGSPP